MTLEIKIEPINEIAPVVFNFEELKLGLKNSLEKYQGLIVTEETIPEAKKNRASLNTLVSAIDAKRKMIKNQFQTPYNEFETKIKELTGMIKAPSDALDLQIKKFEDQKKEDKKMEICEFFHNLSTLVDLKFEQIFDEKWLNIAVSMKKIKEEITAKLEAISKDVEAIKSFKSEFELSLLDRYMQNLNLSEVLQEKNRLEAKKAEQVKASEAKPAPQPQYTPMPIPVAQTEAAKPMEQPKETLQMWLEVTIEQKTALRLFLLDSKINFGRIE
jgi:hypothetical protein